MAIDINTASLKTAANKLTGVASDLNEQMRSLTKVKSNVNSAWISDSADIYVEELQTVENNLKKLSAEAESLSKAITQYVEKVEQIEKEASERFQE